jgi:hypothetical protein
MSFLKASRFLVEAEACKRVSAASLISWSVLLGCVRRRYQMAWWRTHKSSRATFPSIPFNLSGLALEIVFATAASSRTARSARSS